MIGHHAGREGIAGRGDEDAGELGEEEIGICGDGVVELGLAEGEESGVLVWSRLGSGQVWGTAGDLGIEMKLTVFSGRAS